MACYIREGETEEYALCDVGERPARVRENNLHVWTCLQCTCRDEIDSRACRGKRVLNDGLRHGRADEARCDVERRRMDEDKRLVGLEGRPDGFKHWVTEQVGAVCGEHTDATA